MFSVIIPYYNKSAYIIRCIDSVMNQSFRGFEIIVVDDGSTDNGIELISKKYGDRINHISKNNEGVSIARNSGIKKAKYKYIAFLDADDAWHSEYLDSMNWIIKNEHDVKIIGSHYSRTIDFLNHKRDAISYFKFKNYFKQAIRNTYFTSSSTVIQKKFFDENKGFNNTLKKGEDLDVWFRAIQSGGNSFYINNTLVYYSDEDSNQVTKSKIALENDLVGNINAFYKDLKLSNNNKNFNRFISLYVYFNLYPYFFDIENKVKARLVLKESEHHFSLMKLVYLIPFSLGEKLIKSKRYSRFIRLYLKFIIRFNFR
jgi:glycosyltransferase involved in cell wall biosynthesis